MEPVTACLLYAQCHDGGEKKKLTVDDVLVMNGAQRGACADALSCGESDHNGNAVVFGGDTYLQ